MADEIFEQVLAAARARGVSDVEAIVTGGDEALTRFANNTIHQNVAEHTRSVSVRAIVDGRTARATTNRLDRDGVEDVVEQAIAIAKLTEPDSELLPLVTPAVLPPAGRTGGRTPGATERASTVAEAIRIVEAESQTAAGIYSAERSDFSIFNSRGVSAAYSETMSRFSITAMAANSSGWAKASAVDAADLDPLALARSATQKASASARPRELPPGRYTVILEPAAVLDLVGQMFGDFSATAIRDDRSFLTGRLGKKLFGENITIYDEVAHPLQAGAPFDGEGVPRQKLTLVEKGVACQVAHSRQAAALAGVTPTGHGFPLPNEFGEAPVNIVIAGGGVTLDRMISSSDRAILVTRLWYIREVDPYEKIFTGMTRDGTFLVEDGRVACGVRNFRFNQSLIELLSNVEALSPAVRASGEETFDMVVPAMKVRAFNFTEVTRF
jgi:predicted Zn-dependent protease